jgi:hypothetical protein
MKKTPLLALLAVALSSHASNPPVSGTFSNVQNTDTQGLKPSIKTKMNLIVTVNEGGQQFFIQCFKGEKAGFGVVTVIKQPQLQTKISAGPECPASEVEIELDYEGAIIRMANGWAYLPSGSVHVPLEE